MNTNATSQYSWFKYVYIFIKPERKDVQFLLLSLMASASSGNKAHLSSLALAKCLEIWILVQNLQISQQGLSTTNTFVILCKGKTIFRCHLPVQFWQSKSSATDHRWKHPIHPDIHSNTFMFSVSNLLESIPNGYFITGYDIGTTAVELKKYKCFINHTQKPLRDMMLLVLQLQCDGNALMTQNTQTSHWM
jgi:hypothetical protein